MVKKKKDRETSSVRKAKASLCLLPIVGDPVADITTWTSVQLMESFFYSECSHCIFLLGIILNIKLHFNVGSSLYDYIYAFVHTMLFKMNRFKFFISIFHTAIHIRFLSPS